jgi:hypothetical protein
MILRVDNSKDERKWLLMPKSIYKDDPNWIPHVRQDVQKVFDPKKNKRFKEGKAERWLALDGNGKPLGRIAAFIDGRTANTFEQPTGGIGFFESVDDEQVAFQLFDTAKQWLESEGMEAMDGPVNFGDKDRYWGLLVKNFEDMPSYGMNYNPPYYQGLFESYGFKVYFEQYVFGRSVKTPAQDIFIRKYQQVTSNHDITVDDVKGLSIEQIGEDFRTVYNGAWGGHHNFKEMSSEAAQKIAKAMKPIMDREVIIFARHEGKPIGFFVNLPELNEIFKKAGDNLNWWGKLKFLFHKATTKHHRMVGMVFGVVREWHGKGVEGAIITWFSMNRSPVVSYKYTIMTWIGDFNPKMIRVAENLGSKRDRELYTYRYLFDREKPFERCPIVG